MRDIFWLVLLCVVFVETVAQPAEVRTWTARDGRQLEAEFVGFADGNVQIKRTSDGKVFPIPLERLSDADQAFVKFQTRAEPKPASSPQFDTPLGYYAGVRHIGTKKLKSRVLTGLTNVDGKVEPKYDNGETRAGANEVLLWVRFYAPKTVKNDVHFDKYTIVIDKKTFPVLASTTDMNSEFVEVVRKATTQHGADQSTYLLFAIPEQAKNFRLVYGDTGVDLAMSALPFSKAAAAPPEIRDEKAEARKQAFANGLDYFIGTTKTERVQSREGLLRMLIGIEYELNPEKTDGPFSIVMSFTVKDSASGMNYEHHGISTPDNLKDYKSGRAGAVLLGAQSLKGEGDAIIYLTKKSDTKKPISNKIKVPVLFDK